MVVSTIKLHGREFSLDMSQPIDVSIPLRFDGPQPNAYGVEPASAKACAYGDLVGDTRRGGSCNFESVTLIAHCNGTHTECVGHITNERISVVDCLKDVFIPAVLVTVEPEKTNDGDLLVTRARIEEGLTSQAASASGTNAFQSDEIGLIVRTLPNDDSKLTRPYDNDNMPPYFTAEAMHFIVECGVKHLIVDLPSIDRLYDEGKLQNHRIFWNVEDGKFEINNNSRIHNTITEMVYLPDAIEDGKYLLNIQIAPFVLDASPSRPLLFPLL